MANSKLTGNYYNIPSEIITSLTSKLNSYTGNKKKAIGYITVRNLITQKQISYENAKKIINTYKKASQSPKDNLTLYFFEPIINFINNLLKVKRTGLKNVSKGLSTVQDNVFLKQHEKERNGTEIPKLSENKIIIIINESIYKKIISDDKL